MQFNITQEMIDAASGQEEELLQKSPTVIAAENEHLKQRVVMLRAYTVELEKKLKEFIPDEPAQTGEGVEPAERPAVVAE